MARTDRGAISRRGRSRDLRAHSHPPGAPRSEPGSERIARCDRAVAGRGVASGCAVYRARTPELFADEDHLNRTGSLQFSRLLGRDVADVLTRAAPARVSAAAASAAPSSAGVASVAPAAPSSPATTPPRPHRSLSWYAAAAGIGIPLLFTSYEFWLFVAIVAAIFYFAPRAARRWILLLASYYFYARWNAWYVVFLWILTASDYLIAVALERTRERSGRDPRALLALGIAANLAFLGTFKYANFASGTVAALVGMHQNPWLVALFVPIGISFHTFQSISYLVDVYRGRMAAIRRLSDYALYLAFFPQLLAGPIVRAGLFLGSCSRGAPPVQRISATGWPARLRAGEENGDRRSVRGRRKCLFGGSRRSSGRTGGVVRAVAFSMQIYFDFSGYSDIAIGCARLFGFVFPENFGMPYLATSITDFWHRWHITLSTWLRDYLYIPLGGSRGGTLATLRNLMITMLLGQTWHGAQWTFVAWGGVHGALLCIERIGGAGRAVAGRNAATAARVALDIHPRLAGVGALPLADLRRGDRRLSDAGRRRGRGTDSFRLERCGRRDRRVRRVPFRGGRFALGVCVGGASPGGAHRHPGGRAARLELLTWQGVSPSFIYFR